ncbi:hypothetical protein VNO77_34114 [Canavalia gladiata]|uniref:Inhibitor of Bruton tyrosine kinase n=1 Tax=Canavalia gladiata TaxID=3824 RepID=A0AAN9PYA4_CANGL
MELAVSPQLQKQNLQTPGCKSLSVGSQKDLWLAVREGSLADVDSALALLKKSGGNVNLRNTFGLTPLHIATWRNHVPIVRKLLEGGADPNARDGESGWGSLHRALHFGHLAVASVLLQHAASATLEDSKYRIPVDLLSGPVSQVFANEHYSVATEVFSWGSGTNYQLGTGNAHIQKLPCKVDSLNGSMIKLVSAAKFHSVAVTARGEVYTWGFGRGGRLGHPDFDIHSGQAAVITPRQVTGLGSRRVKAIAAAKHHTVIATEGGEVFTWGSNREGQLGYTSVDTQPTPRRVTSLRAKVIAVAAANKHTSVVSDIGEVFTWGCNREGQLGYGTSNSASNYTPHVVESLKGKTIVSVSAAKYHTVVLGSDGEVYTWGHRLVTPTRVVITRNLKKNGSTPLKFHRMKRLRVVSIAAGMVHSMVLTDDGALFYWVSLDPELKCQQLYAMCGRNMVSISAGKYWTAAATDTGDVYIWDGKSKDKPLVATRLHGVKRATSVSVGETHLLIVASLYHPVYPLNMIENSQKQKLNNRDDMEELNEGILFEDVESDKVISGIQNDTYGKKSIPSLKSLCEKVAAECLVEPRNAIQLLEIADSLGADDLKKYCEEIVLRNLDYIFTISSHAISSASLDVLANLERSLNQRSSESWSYRRFPSSTATFSVIINSEEDDSDMDFQRTPLKMCALKLEKDQSADSFLLPKDDPDQGVLKVVRALRKKLQQIEVLEVKQSKGYLLDDQQIAKLQSKSALWNSLSELGVRVETSPNKELSSVLPERKNSKKGKQSRKQRIKSGKPSVEQTELEAIYYKSEVTPESVKDLLDNDILQIADSKVEEDAILEQTTADQGAKDSACGVQKKDSLKILKNKSQSPKVSKKKSKKGGLSMFLSGALDDVPKEVIPSPSTPKNDSPAWGGAKFIKTSASIREIQNEQSKTMANQPARSKEQVEDHSDSGSVGKVKLSSFLPSSPIPVSSTRSSQASDGERSTPPWAASGTPPHLSQLSFRDIQMQQGKKQHSFSHSPKSRTAGFTVAAGQGSPSEAIGVNRWFKPEVETPSSIRSIQIEEKAMKDLKRFYSSVKIVRKQS